MVDTAGTIVTAAGMGTFDGRYTGPGALVAVGCPAGLATGRDGRVYFVDTYSARVRVLTPVPY